MNAEGKEAMTMASEEGKEGKEGTGIGGRLAVLAGEGQQLSGVVRSAGDADDVLLARIEAFMGSPGAAQFGQGGQGPAAFEVEASDLARLLMLGREAVEGRVRGEIRAHALGVAQGERDALLTAVARLLGACGAIKAGRGRPVSVASALADLRAAYWRVSGHADELARRDAAAAGLVSGAVSGLPAAEQLGVA